MQNCINNNIGSQSIIINCLSIFVFMLFILCYSYVGDLPKSQQIPDKVIANLFILFLTSDQKQCK
jgi:hypothetical protein